jgi:hypothetical protein
LSNGVGYGNPPVEHQFRRGQSGNPGGRPKGLARKVREVIGEDADALVGFWTGVLSGEILTTKTTLDTNGKAVTTEYSMVPVSVSDRIAVSKLIAERGWGRAPEFVPIEADPLDLADKESAGMAERLEARLNEMTERRRKNEAERSARERGDALAPSPDQAQ